MLTKKVIIFPIDWWSFYLYQCHIQRLQYRHCIYKDNKLLFISHFVSMYQTHLEEFSKADFFICSVWKIYLSSVFCISWLCHWWLTCRLNKHPVIRVSVNCSEGCVHKVKWVGLLLPNIFYSLLLYSKVLSIYVITVVGIKTINGLSFFRQLLFDFESLCYRYICFLFNSLTSVPQVSSLRDLFFNPDFGFK